MASSPSCGNSAKPSSWLRSLDVEDFYILALMHQGIRCGQVAKILGLSFPAISQRVKKIDLLFNKTVFERGPQRGVYLTDVGTELALKASEAIGILESVRPELASLRNPAVVLEELEDEEHGETDDCGFLGPKV